MKLYELAEQYQELLELAAGDESFDDTLEGIRGELAGKVENCAAVVKTLQAEAEAIKAEEARLTERRKALLSSADRVKAYIHRNLEECGMRKVKGKLFTVSIQANSPSVVIDNLDQIPVDLKRMKWEPDKTAISELLKEGKPVAGAHLENSESLRIR